MLWVVFWLCLRCGEDFRFLFLDKKRNALFNGKEESLSSLAKEKTVFHDRPYGEKTNSKTSPGEKTPLIVQKWGFPNLGLSDFSSVVPWLPISTEWRALTYENCCLCQHRVKLRMWDRVGRIWPFNFFSCFAFPLVSLLPCLTSIHFCSFFWIIQPFSCHQHNVQCRGAGESRHSESSIML